MEESQFQQYAANLEQAVERVNSISDKGARAIGMDLMQSLMDLHGAALTRIVELLMEGGEHGQASLVKLGADPLVCGLLVLYGVHPVSLEDRVRQAIESVTPQIQKLGGSARLLSMTDGKVELSIESSSQGCHSSPDALLKVVEQAIRGLAPEIAEISNKGQQSNFVSLSQLQPVASKEQNYEKSTA